ncbi:hypothetical protein BBK36DRAFT_1131195 [Trichoderma citrinoviride]|uniref:Uncharacterized protein n=1 Tax=Trichoderma citrinoviride TaxID=58853 RepID=A0A2T4AX89_9HYPO|nr:hypothetical protein BBK36DRAFT_1131195 [Trichoderma citrinoviride]PTB61692.1 hypothetical protein BBK36DRAFT_1131195 [Trichoderma citrinoviride]
MTTGFYHLLRRAAADPASLVRTCPDGMPRIVRKILGKRDLSEKDLLALPIVPSPCNRRLVYVDVATRLRQEQVREVTRNFRGRPKPYKAATPSDLEDALGIKLFVGLSLNRLGGHTRIRQHEGIANGHLKKVINMHYDEVLKPDVICNFRMISVYQNPYADHSYDGQDPSRWVAPFVEGLIMVYLGLYTEKNRSSSKPHFSPQCSYP